MSTRQATHIDVSAIPHELRLPNRWVIWNYESRNGKQTKVPHRADAPSRRASVTDPSTFSTFASAHAVVEDGHADGIGFVLGDGFAGVDIDGCRNPKTGEITDVALNLISKLNSHTEVSPSGTGVKVFVRGALPKGGRRKANLEMYDDGRFFTVTGEHVAGTPTTVEERTTALEALHQRTFPDPSNPAPGNKDNHPSTPRPLDDEDLIQRAINARNGVKFRSLWNGHWQGDYDSQSEADLALCNHVAFWTDRAPDRMDRLFRRSGLMRAKWDERHYAGGKSYGDETIRKAVAGCHRTYGDEADSPTAPHGTTSAGRMVIDAGDLDLPRVSARALRALQRANEPPWLFRHGGRPVRIEQDDTDQLVLQTLHDNRLRYEVARAADWVKYTRDGKQPALPPKHVVADLLASPSLDIPILTAVIRAPAFTASGDLHDRPGYHADGTYYAPPVGLSVPDVPRRPSDRDINRARSLLLDDLLADFPFVDESERAHAVALLALPFVRDLVLGPTPLHLIEKPAPGTGGTLLAETLVQPSSGDHVAAMTEGRDEDEWRKRITARLRSSPPAILIDNLRRRLDSSALAAVITTRLHEDRILGTSDTVRLPVRCSWIATGNNPTLSAELTRRSVRIRLDARTDRPWLRKGFRHPDLPAWALAHRGELIWAALVLGRAWIVAGRPDGTPTLGMFEQWSRVLGGVLDVANIPGFLGNLSDFYDESDAEGAVWRLFIEEWWDKHSDRAVGVAELWSLVDPVNGNPIDVGLGDGNERSQKTRLGKRLAEMRDRQFDDVRLVRGGDSKGAHQWRLVNVG